MSNFFLAKPCGNKKPTGFLFLLITTKIHYHINPYSMLFRFLYFYL
jgi:hypothetical protein